MGARGRHAREEGARLPERPMKIVSRPLSKNYLAAACVICQKFWQKTIDLAQTKCAKALYIYILGLNMSVTKISQVI